MTPKPKKYTPIKEDSLKNIIETHLLHDVRSQVKIILRMLTL